MPAPPVSFYPFTVKNTSGSRTQTGHTGHTRAHGGSHSQSVTDGDELTHTTHNQAHNHLVPDPPRTHTRTTARRADRRRYPGAIARSRPDPNAHARAHVNARGATPRSRPWRPNPRSQPNPRGSDFIQITRAEPGAAPEAAPWSSPAACEPETGSGTIQGPSFEVRSGTGGIFWSVQRSYSVLHRTSCAHVYS